MSYINDALRKAQTDKKSPYAAYAPIVSASSTKRSQPKRWFAVVGAAFFVICVAVMTAMLYRLEANPTPAKATLNIANAPIVAPVTPPVVETIQAENTKEPDVSSQRPEERITVEPENDESKKLYAQAFRMHQEGKLEEAKNLYKKVIKNDPRNIEALNNLGVVYMKKNVHKWAIVRLNDALKVKYDYPDAHYNLACLYAQQNDTEKSLAYLKNAIRYNPEVKKWAENDSDLRVMADLPEFKKLLESK